MIDIHEAYDAISNSNSAKGKYRHSLKLVKYHCLKGEIINAQSTISTLTRDYAKAAGITKEQMLKDTEPMLRTCYRNAVPKLLNELEESLGNDEMKNFMCLEHKLKEVTAYAIESMSYTAAELNTLSQTVESLRSKILDTKAKTPEEDITNWETTTLKEANETIDYYLQSEKEE